MHLKGAVMHVASLVRAHEEGMMVDRLFAAINMSKDCYVLLLIFGSVDVKEVRRDEVEVAGVELNLVGKVLDTETEMTELESIS